MNDLISVIIPCKNGENYIREAIEGIKKQGMNVEIIVIDDGSNDNTSKIAQENGCIVIRNEVSKGQVAGKNLGLKKAQGKYILFHDHDDVMDPDVLKKLYDFLESRPDLASVMAKVKDFISPDAKDKTTPIKNDPYYGLFTGAVLIRKSVFDQIGLFDENIHTGEIISFKNKLDSLNLKMEKLDFVATNRRVHDTNFGKTHQKKEFQDYASVLRAKLAAKK